MPKVLIIDDYKEIRDLFGDVLLKVGYDVETIENAEEGVKRILKGGYDLILLDLLMPRRDGIWVLDQIQNKKPKIPNGKIILMGIANDQENHKGLIQEALTKGASDFLDKRISIEQELLAKIKEYIENNGN